MSVNFNLNGKSVTAQAEPDTPLLWVIRDELGLTGTKFGCGMALCGACTVHLNGAPVRSCQTALSAVQGQQVSNSFGISTSGNGLNSTNAINSQGVSTTGTNGINIAAGGRSNRRSFAVR